MKQWVFQQNFFFTLSEIDRIKSTGQYSEGIRLNTYRRIGLVKNHTIRCLQFALGFHSKPPLFSIWMFILHAIKYFAVFNRPNLMAKCKLCPLWHVISQVILMQIKKKQLAPLFTTLSQCKKRVISLRLDKMLFFMCIKPLFFTQGNAFLEIKRQHVGNSF